VLKTCLIADVKYRAAQLGKQEGLGEKDALKRMHRDDESCLLWVDHLFGAKDPWKADLYDLLVPMGKVTVDEAVSLIRENASKVVLQMSEESRAAVDDFILAAQVDLKLAKEGHNVTVSVTRGNALLRINKHVLMLSNLEEELRRIAMSVPGVQSVETKVGSGYYQTDIYRKYDFDLPKPSKVLLVDDEREFAQTLSERLQMREYGSAVVYNGEEALSAVAEDEPEVMVLDLKMPGVDGLEVLRRVKQEHPNVEVIVLTGHGSKEIERECMELGACAYLEKPVDMDTLTKKMQEAYKRLKERQEGN
jgi:CheY-like chemotaxis protein